MTARVSVVVFPGSNCEFDCERAFALLGAAPRLVWHSENELPGSDIVVLPGGFAHGDYLRTGALARFSPIMSAIEAHARSGGLTIGICNGFQILCEAGLLPGAMRKNAGLKFICRWVDLEVVNATTAFTSRAEKGDRLRVPINHFEGNWYVEDGQLSYLEGNGQVVLRYVDNPNGSLGDVACVSNAEGNVFGLMPHPERACESLLGSEDGRVLLGSLLDAVEARRTVSA